ncbi:nuclear transport factor 2 family protein [Marinifilum fragile]|uniref:nuclear transport factor 2 family protein n=1 Tax=Marinifilum fragile TaxID=570161 RepID=UPI002AA6FDE0|nr:nuclear transport factor 2 family protein [Marinifilum fragile]
MKPENNISINFRNKQIMTPKQIIQEWVEAFNQGDADQIAEFYHQDAINHQVANQPIQGKEAIRKMFAEELAAAEMTCIVENIFEDGDWAILEWKDPLGLRGCGFFQILDGKIMFQRGYWDKLSFLRMHNMSIPQK